MISSILSSVTHFIITVISALGYPGVGLLMAIESAAIPLPSEVIMPFAGFLASTGRFSLIGIALAGAIGSAVGSALLYWIGYVGGRPLVVRYGKYILISEHDLDTADKFFQRFGSWSMFLGRVLPVVRTYISFPAGISRVPFWKLIWYSFLGSFIWSLLLGYIGMKLGQNWDTLHNLFRKFDMVIVAMIVLVAAWWVYRHVKNRSQKIEVSN